MKPRYHYNSVGFTFLIFFIFLVFLADTCYGFDSVWGLYTNAVKKDPLVLEAEAKLKASFAEKPLARSQLMPHLEASMGQGYYDKNISGIGPRDIKKDYWGDNYGARLIQPIFNGQAYVSLKMAQSLISAQEAQLLFAKQELIRRVAIAYLDLLDAKAQLKAAEDRVRLDRKVLDRARTFLKVGTGDIVSVKEAEARLDSAKAAVIRARNLVSVKRTNLSIVTHTQVGDILDVRRFRPVPPDPDDPHKWIQAALDNQPILKEASKRLLLATQKVEHEKRARWPRIDLEAMADYANGQFLPDVIYREAHGVFKFTFPLYLGGSIGAKVQRAQEEAVAARHRLDHFRDVVTLQTKNAFSRLKDSVALVKAATLALESAKVSMDATNKGYEVGTRDVIDVLDQTDKYIFRKKQYFHALYNHLKARILLKSASGTIGEADLKSLEGMLKRQPEEKDSKNG